MTGYDIIGDIHGHADELKSLLRKMGYGLSRGCYRHPERQAIFLGDFVDRGPKQRETINLVRAMVDAGTALSVMGNHEFNAICYATGNGDGGYLRPHGVKNRAQHVAFLSEFPIGSDDHAAAISWFKSLPIYLDLGGFLVVHACWCKDSIENLSTVLTDTNTLQKQAYVACSHQGSVQHGAIETLLKGPEQALPAALYFKDIQGQQRKQARLRWWVDDSCPSSARLDFGDAELNDRQRQVLERVVLDFRARKLEKPVFFGHYWLDQDPAPLTDKAACLDYSVAKDGKLVAYRWNGEKILSRSNYIW